MSDIRILYIEDNRENLLLDEPTTLCFSCHVITKEELGKFEFVHEPVPHGVPGPDGFCVEATVTGGGEPVDPASVRLSLDRGTGWQELAMSPQGDDLYRACIPAEACQETSTGSPTSALTSCAGSQWAVKSRAEWQ